MKKYPAYKSSGVEWIGEIPQNWKVDKFRRVSYMKGRIGWQGLKQSEFTTKGPFLITGMNFKDGVIRWDEVYHITKERYEEAPEIQLKEGDVLMTKDGTIGKLLFVDHLPGPAPLNSHLLLLRPLNERYFPRYLYYQLQSKPFLHHIELTKTGTTFFGVTQEAVGEYKIILPSLKEQQAISTYLDEKTKLIDDTIAKKQQLIQLLQEERTAMINQAVTRGLDPNVKLKPSGIEWLGDTPEHWEVKKLKYSIRLLTDFTANGSFASLAQNVKYIDTVDYSRLIRLTDLRNDLKDPTGVYLDKPSHEYLRKSELFGGEILMANVGAYAGFVCKMPLVTYKSTLGPNMYLLKFNNTLDIDFSYMLLISNYIKNQLTVASTSTAQPKLNKDNVKDLIAVVPPKSEQIEIVKALNNITNSVDNTIRVIEKEVKLIQEFRTTLINDVVTGKLCIL